MKLIFLTLLLTWTAYPQTVTIGAQTSASDRKTTQLTLRPVSTVTYSISSCTVTAPATSCSLTISASSSRLQPAAVQFTLTKQPSSLFGTPVLSSGPSGVGKSLSCTSPTTDTLVCIISGVGSLAGIPNGPLMTIPITPPTTAGAYPVSLGSLVSANPWGFALISTGGGTGSVNVPLILTVTAIICQATEIEPGEQVSCTVTLNGPAPSGGLSIALDSSDTTKATVPATTTATATATTAPVTVTGR